MLALGILVIPLRRRIALVAVIILRVLLGNMLKSISILSLSLIGESGTRINLRLMRILSLSLIGEYGTWINLRLLSILSLTLIEESGAAKVLLGLSISKLIYGLISGKPKVRLWSRLLTHKVLISTRGRKLVLFRDVFA